MIARTLVALLAVALGLLGALAWQPPASAHASLVSADPADGTRLDTLPAQVRLEFSEPMSAPAYVVVTAPDGTQVQQGEAAVADTRVSIALSGAGAEGTYGLAFRAVSADGHPVSGRLVFVVGDGPLEEPYVAPGQDAGDAGTAAPEAASEQAGDTSSGTSSDKASSRSGTDGGGVSLTQVQVGVGAVLFLLAGGLLLWSRRVGPGDAGPGD
ncbi:copper resistance protein CopC [Nocardioides sp. zg-ZUI104]|uniref:copper resistance CopC family protein n=1 Tax=Nocardioides faecalis TaxID=2803858 RepID=UPI001BD0F541|nr:copper resistance CopC family protein [Nocardioides faecalis]MBS4753559.1 copper resistance protein CopC [Nocardioides faecalis]